MAPIRRVVRKVERPQRAYFDEQLWPVNIALVALGVFLMGVSLAYQPLWAEPWFVTAWPSLIGVPLITAACMVLLARVDNRTFRRSLQLSIVLCAIAHVALIVQLVQTRIFAPLARGDRQDTKIAEQIPPKIIPEYHPTQLLPEEDRPRQEFERPVETQTPEPSRQPEQVVRHPSEQAQSPAQPQPVPVPEQQRTTEPNVVSRNVPNEVTPRLAPQPSLLSKQAKPSEARTSQPLNLPEPAPRPAEEVAASPSAANVSRQQTESQRASRVAREPAATPTNSLQSIARRAAEDPSQPAAERASSSKASRTLAKANAAESDAVVPVTRSTPAASKTTVEASPQSSAVARSVAALTGERSAAAPSQPQRAAAAQPSLNLSRSQAAENLAVPPNVQPSAANTPSRAVAVASVPTSPATIENTASGTTTTGSRADTPQPAALALSRGQAGIAGSGRSQNLDQAAGGNVSPALVASSAARRADSTQQARAADSLSPSAPAKLVRSRAGASLPTSPVKADSLAPTAASGGAQVAELTASASASLVQADAAARRDALTAAKGSGEVDLGPTQVVTERGASRAGGGGQPEISFQAAAQPPIARKSSGGSPGGATAAAELGELAAPLPAESGFGTPAPSAVTAERSTSSPLPAGDALARAAPGLPSDPGSSELQNPVATLPTKGANTEAAPLGEGQSLAEASDAPSATGRSIAAASPTGSTTVTEIPEVGPRSAVAQAEIDHLASTTSAAVHRQPGEALAVSIAAPAGPGGLGSDYSPDVGINTRQARAESMDVQLRTARFVRSQAGGLPAVSTAAVVAADAFASRSARLRGDLPAGGRGTPAPQTEEAIERGLAFLARHQGPEGGWSLQGFPEGAQLFSDTAATALAVIAFQGAGYNHREFQFKDVVRGGLDYLLKNQKEDGDLFLPLQDASNRSVWLYSHSLAAIALCEAYGMTQDPALREAAQKSIDFIVASQHTERGGWRYSPGASSDTSVTGWMMMALKSGELAKLRVPKNTTAKISRWLDSAQQSAGEPHLYRYNPFAADTPEQRHGRVASKTMTAVGLLMRLYSGWKRDHQAMVRGAQFLAENLPASGSARDPQRDTYYWYYATQVMAHMGGGYWQAWNDKLHPLLVNSQRREGALNGSWDPQGPIPDRWGAHAGRLYVTTMNLLSLEVQYRKLPLYEDTVE